ncbi:MAG: haloalkane dehalogenase [Acidobacteria bacterium]|nr:haloalkane dehalogenase [Acidobacteriota bacterium]
MHTLRTPDERFENLSGFDYAAHYVDIDDGDGGTLRVHYVDEGPTDAAPVLLLHGEPSWSYLYRHMIAPLVDSGHRVVVPDQVGFGRSDKPTDPSDYSYARHVAWMSSLVFGHLDLSNITFFGQDWGGLIGLRLVAAAPARFARVAIGNTGLPDGSTSPGEAFLQWQSFSQHSPAFPIGRIVAGGCAIEPDADVIAAYDAPFPTDEYKAGARVWPSLVPTTPEDPEAPANEAAWKVLERFEKPFLCCFSDLDAITKGGERPFLERLPGTRGQPHTTIEGAGHFLQEDAGPALAQVLIDFIER